MVGNAILPETDPDPTHEGIQKIDRTTVPELKELPTLAGDLQTALDNAEGNLNPLGLPDRQHRAGPQPVRPHRRRHATHFEQVYQRALGALQNALAAFDDAKDVTRLMRSEQDSLAGFQADRGQSGTGLQNALIELYGTPYPDDIGPGQTYQQGYNGPDTFITCTSNPGVEDQPAGPPTESVWRIATETFRLGWVDAASGISDFNFITKARVDGIDLGLEPNPFDPDYTTDHYVEYTLAPHGFFQSDGLGQSAQLPGRNPASDLGHHQGPQRRLPVPRAGLHNRRLKRLMTMPIRRPAPARSRRLRGYRRNGTWLSAPRRSDETGDFKAEAGHGGHPARTREEAHLADAEIAQDLGADTVGSRIPLAPGARGVAGQAGKQRFAVLRAVHQDDDAMAVSGKRRLHLVDRERLRLAAGVDEVRLPRAVDERAPAFPCRPQSHP